MPVYIRKDVSYTPPSLDKIPAEQEDDFINDPEQLRDSLPQPYRMIDKTVRNLIDSTWEVIAKREEERLAEARKVRPPLYESQLALEGAVPGAQNAEKQNLSFATCMCDSPDGQFIFMGLPTGLVALESQSQQITGSWEDPTAEITYIKAYSLAPQIYLIVTIDDMGIGRLFAFGNNRYFLLRVLNATAQESEVKTLVSKLEASTEGDYIGAVMENPSSQDLWLEVHKLPRDTWVSDLDTMISAQRKKEEEKRDEQQSEVDGESVVASEILGSQADPADPSTASLSGAQPPADTQDSAPQDPLSGDFKFGSPQLIMKVKAPPPITGQSYSSLQSVFQKVDSGDVVGTGQGHAFTTAHLELRQSVFTHLHDGLLKYLPQEDAEEQKVQQYPNYHFLMAGRMLPMGLEQANLHGRPTTIAVWWPGSTNFMQYSLIKQSKDVEFKPDLVWPVTNKITCSEVSPDTNLIAIGMENGNVVVWDKYMGTQRGVVNISDRPVVQLRFLDPALYPQDTSYYPPYHTKRGAYLLAMAANSALFTITLAPGQPLISSLVDPPVEKDEDTITMLQPFPSWPDMMLTVTAHGAVQVRDTLQGKVLCQIKLPDKFEILSPWEPTIALGCQGHFLYVKGNKPPEEDGEEDGSGSQGHGTVFVYQLRLFPSLDEHWKIKRTSLPFTVHTTIDQRVDALMADRLANQAMRKDRMQERWQKMKDEINNIHNMKEIARINAEKRPLVTPGSVSQFVPAF